MIAIPDFLKGLLTTLQPFFTALLNWDKTMFKHINQDWTNSFFDWLMPFITDFHHTWYLVLALLIFIIYKAKMRAVFIILGCILAVALADSFSSQILKPWVHRSRPSFQETKIRLLVPPQGSPSFPSNHAANCFAAATFIGLYILGAGPLALFIAFLVGYSRVYVGVHYPLDVIGGAIIGFLAGLCIYKIFLVAADLINPQPLRALPKKWKKKSYLKR